MASNLTAYSMGSPDITDDTLFICTGSKSCMYSNLEIGSFYYPEDTSDANEGLMTLHAAFAAYESTIVNRYTGDEAVNIYIYGNYAGFGARLECLDNTICNIDCKGNGCLNLIVYCEDLATCDIDCDDTSWDICPNYESSDGTVTLNTNIRYMPSTLNESISLDIDENDFIFSIFYNMLQVDFYQFIPKTIEYYSNNEDLFTSNDFITSRNFNADDESKCDVLCQSFRNCSINYAPAIESTDNSVCCVAEFGCEENTITIKDNGKNLFCDAEVGCVAANVILENSDANVYATSDLTLGRGNVTATESNNENKLIVTGEVACRECTIKGLHSVICDANWACEAAKFVNVQNIFGTTYQALFSTRIEFEYDFDEGMWSENKLNIYLLGYEAAFGISIYCNADTDCTIYCLDKGCSSYTEDPDSWTFGDDCTCNFVNLTSPYLLPTRLFLRILCLVFLSPFFFLFLCFVRTTETFPLLFYI